MVATAAWRQGTLEVCFWEVFGVLLLWFWALLWERFTYFSVHVCIVLGLLLYWILGDQLDNYRLCFGLLAWLPHKIYLLVWEKLILTLGLKLFSAIKWQQLDAQCTFFRSEYGFQKLSSRSSECRCPFGVLSDLGKKMHATLGFRGCVFGVAA